MLYLLPDELFFHNIIIPHLKLKPICRLAQINKGYKELCNDNEIWKLLYISLKNVEYYKKEYNNAVKMINNNLIHFPRLNIRMNTQVPVEFHNISNITYELLHITGFSTHYRRSSNQGRKFKLIKPNKRFRIKTYPTHRWIAKPYIKSIPLDDLNTYESKCYIVDLNDIYNNEIKVYIGGDIYDNERSIDIVGLPVPSKTRNFKCFKKKYMQKVKPQIMKNIERLEKEKKNIHMNIIKSQKVIKEEKIKIINRHETMRLIDKNMNVMHGFNTTLSTF